jgi:hypothetical protein
MRGNNDSPPSTIGALVALAVLTLTYGTTTRFYQLLQIWSCPRRWQTAAKACKSEGKAWHEVWIGTVPIGTKLMVLEVAGLGGGVAVETVLDG